MVALVDRAGAQAGEVGAGGVRLLLPGAALFEDLAVGGDALILRVLDFEVFRQIGFEPVPELATEGGVLGRIGEVHGGSSLRARLTAGEISLNAVHASRSLISS